MPFKNNRGEAAILEMTLILPLISMILSVLIIWGIRLADRSIMQACVEEEAASVSLHCSVPGYDYIDDGKIEEVSAGTVSLLFSEKNPYRYLWGFGETDSYEAVLNQKLSDYSLVKFCDIDTEIEIKTDLRGDFVYVSATKEYDSPIPLLEHTCRVSAVSRVSDGDETVRNTDLFSYLYDYAGELIKERGGIGKILSDIGIDQSDSP